MIEPMKKRKISIFLFIFLGSCGSNDLRCDDPKMKRIYTEEFGSYDKVSYTHTVMLDRYDEDCFNDYDFIYMADRYLDTVTIDLPVGAITVVKPFDFTPYYDGRDNEPIKSHSIVDIFYADETMAKKIPEISAIGIWIGGERKDLDELHVSSRQDRMNYYHSKRK